MLTKCTPQFSHSQITDHLLVHVAKSSLPCSRDKTSRTERLNSGNQHNRDGEEREALLVRLRLITDGVFHDRLPPTGSAQCTEQSACENPNHGGLCDLIKILR